MIFMKENKIFLFHHCLKSKEERKELRFEYGNQYTNYIDLVGINLNGELEYKKTLFGSKGFFVKKSINIKLCKALNDGRILIYKDHDRKFKLGRIRLIRISF